MGQLSMEDFNSEFGKFLDGEEGYEEVQKRAATSSPSQADTAPPAPTPRPSSSGTRAFNQVKAQAAAQNAPPTPHMGLNQGPPAFDEAEFQKWYVSRAKRLGLDQNPDDPAHHYDYRAAYKAGAEPDATGHWPSDFKASDHPRRFLPVGPDGGWEDTITGTPVRAPGMASVHQFEDENPTPDPPRGVPPVPSFEFDATTGIPGQILSLLKKAGLRDREVSPEEQEAIVSGQNAMNTYGMR